VRGPVRVSRDSRRSVTYGPAWPPGPRSVASRFEITQLGVQCRAVEISQPWKKWLVVASSALLNESATEETMSAIASSDKHDPARIIERRDLSEGCWSIRVDPGDHSSPRADNTQRWVWTTRISASNEPIESCYHLTRKVWNLLIELEPQGELTRHLDKLLLGDTAPVPQGLTNEAIPVTVTGGVDDLVRKYADLWKLRPETTTACLCGRPTMCENGQASSRAPVGWRVLCSKGFISSRRRKRRRSSRPGRFVMRLTSHGRCTMRPSQNPNPYQV
jgi:hypothetical protein